MAGPGLDPGQRTGPPPRRAAPNAQEISALMRARLIESRLTPNAISMTGFVLNVVAAVLVWERYFFLAGVAFIVGSIMDTLDGRYSRMSGKGTPFGAFLDSTTDRLGEAVMLGAIGLVFSRHGNEFALAAVFAALAGSFLVSYTRARAEALSLKGDVGIGSRAERVFVIVSGLFLAPWGLLPWAVYLLNVTAWVTVVQRIVYVRRQLRNG
jgi:CDP-diacylglycerol---glycerol-3-phosphate 3-phosphatidyltransferase